LIEFSIILPVRNGGAYIKKCVASILSQTIPGFNLIILDSGSTDGTVEWINSLKDTRIDFYPTNRPLSIEENWSRIKDVSRKEWMTIIGHDDLLLPHYLEIMQGLIEQYPDASLYAPHFNFIDANSAILRECKPMPAVQTAQELLEKFLLMEIDAVGLVMRSKDYDAVGGIPLYPGLLFADFPLWVELTRLSCKATASPIGLSYRVHTGSTTATSVSEKYHAAYELYIQYLQELKEKNAGFRQVINEHVTALLRSRCIEFSKKLLAISKKERKTFTSVAALARAHKKYADSLIDNNTFDPSRLFKVRLAKLIDSTAVGRSLYLLLKR